MGEPLSRGEAEVVIARAAGLVRSLAAVVSAGSRDCNALATSLEQWLAQHRAELADIARDAARIPEDLRAELMRSELGDEAALFEGLGSLDACAALPAAAEAMAALESIAAGSSGDSGNSGGSGS